jgi:hypothetical protein
VTQPAQRTKTMIPSIPNVINLGRVLPACPILARKHPPATPGITSQYRHAQTPPPRGQGRTAPGAATHGQPPVMRGMWQDILGPGDP